MTRDELVEAKFHGVPLWKTTAKRTTERVLTAAYNGITLYGKVPAGQRRSAPDDTAWVTSAVPEPEVASLDPHLR